MNEEKHKREVVAIVRKINSSMEPTPYYEISFIKNVKAGERLELDPLEIELYRRKK